MSRDDAARALAELALEAQQPQYPAFSLGTVVSITADSGTTVPTITVAEDGSDEELGPIAFIGDVLLLSIGDRVLMANIHHSPRRTLVAIGRTGTPPGPLEMLLVYEDDAAAAAAGEMRYLTRGTDGTWSGSPATALAAVHPVMGGATTDDGTFDSPREIDATAGAFTEDFRPTYEPVIFTMSDGAEMCLQVLTGGSGRIYVWVRAVGSTTWTRSDPVSFADRSSQVYIGRSASFARAGDVVYVALSFTSFPDPNQTGTVVYGGVGVAKVDYNGGTPTASTIGSSTLNTADATPDVVQNVAAIYADEANSLVHVWIVGERTRPPVASHMKINRLYALNMSDLIVAYYTDISPEETTSASAFTITLDLWRAVANLGTIPVGSEGASTFLIFAGKTAWDGSLLVASDETPYVWKIEASASAHAVTQETLPDYFASFGDTDREMTAYIAGRVLNTGGKITLAYKVKRETGAADSYYDIIAIDRAADGTWDAAWTTLVSENDTLTPFVADLTGPSFLALIDGANRTLRFVVNDDEVAAGAFTEKTLVIP